MHRPFVAAIMAAPLLFAPIAVGAAAEDPPRPAEPATRLVAEALESAAIEVRDGDPRAAVSALEAILRAAGSADRPAILDALRHSYPAAARRAEAESQPRRAASYRENLAILERRSPSRKGDDPPSASPALPTDAAPGSRSQSAPEAREVTTSVPDPIPPAPAPDPFAPPALAPATGAASTGDSPVERVAVGSNDRPRPDLSAPAPLPAPESFAFDPGVQFAALESADESEADPAGAERGDSPGDEAAIRDQPGETPGEQALDLPRPDAEPRPPAPGVETSSPERPDSTTAQGPATPASDPAVDALTKADRAFQAKSYDEAGSLYGRLAEAGRLPDDHLGVWAYCRRVAVVRRINAASGDPREWQALAAEVAAISKLTPNHWYDEYLNRVIAERASKPRRGVVGRRRGDGTIVRGASPDDEPPAPVGGGSIGDPRAAGEPEANAPSDGPGTVPYWSRWQIHESTNFRVYHADPALARRVAELAEAARDEVTERWTGAAPAGTWSPVCEVYLDPDPEAFAARTGQAPDSSGFSTSDLLADRVIGRRINLNLHADPSKPLEAIVPHEVTHIVLAELFPSEPVPRWADEGMAVLAEPTAEQARRIADLEGPLGGGSVFTVEQLMGMDTPGPKHWPLFYAQSVSLTRFLYDQGPPSRFVAFVRATQSAGPDAALRDHYGIDGVSDLQARWISYAKSDRDGDVRTASAAADEVETRR